MTHPEATTLLKSVKIKVVSCEMASEHRIEAQIEPYAGDPRTLTDKLNKSASVRGVTWQWNGADELQTLWIRV